VRHVESWLAINPKNPKNLIATSIAFDKRTGSVVYASLDGGKNWLRATHGAQADKYFESMDPMVTLDGDGNAYFTTLRQGFSVWKSTDGGRSWGEPVLVPVPPMTDNS